MLCPVWGTTFLGNILQDSKLSRGLGFMRKNGTKYGDFEKEAMGGANYHFQVAEAVKPCPAAPKGNQGQLVFWSQAGSGCL